MIPTLSTFSARVQAYPRSQTCRKQSVRGLHCPIALVSLSWAHTLLRGPGGQECAWGRSAVSGQGGRPPSVLLSSPRTTAMPTPRKITLSGSPSPPLAASAPASRLALSVITLSPVSPNAKLRTCTPAFHLTPQKSCLFFFLTLSLCFPGNLHHTHHPSLQQKISLDLARACLGFLIPMP